METNQTELNDKLYDAQEQAVMKVRKYRPVRGPGKYVPVQTLEFENRAKAKQVMRIAEEIADLVLAGPEAETEPVLPPMGLIVEDAPEYTQPQPSSYKPFACLSEYKVA